MIRWHALFICSLMILVSTPALAGNVSFKDGEGSWVPTRCAAPQAPSDLPTDPETPANDLNAKMTPRAQYMASMEAYMNCLSQEAEADAAASSQMIIRSAQDMISKTHKQLEAMSSPTTYEMIQQ